MLVLLAQATHGYRAHLACGVLREHGLEAHVFHEMSGILHGGASTTTASLWVHEDELVDAREILSTAPIEPLPEGNPAEPMNIHREFLPPIEAVVIGVAGSVFAGTIAVALCSFVPELVTKDLSKSLELILAFLLTLLMESGVAMGFGLTAGLLSVVPLQVIRLYRGGSWFGSVLVTIAVIVIACSVALV